MSNNTYSLPFTNSLIIEKRGPVNSVELENHLKDYVEEGISFIVRLEDVEKNHGGYVFNIYKKEDAFHIFSIKKRMVGRLDGWEELSRFVNHSTGRQFDENMWSFCQKMNFHLFNEEVQYPI